MYQQRRIRLAGGVRGGAVRKKTAFCITRYMLVGAIANRTPAGLFAHAEKNLPRFFGLVLDGLNFCRSVAAVAKRLSLTASARTPKIILSRFNVDAFRAAPDTHDLVRVLDVRMRHNASMTSPPAASAPVLRSSALTFQNRESRELSCHIVIDAASSPQPVAHASHARQSLLGDDRGSGCCYASGQLST
jgi:hypothetical protein